MHPACFVSGLWGEFALFLTEFQDSQDWQKEGGGRDSDSRAIPEMLLILSKRARSLARSEMLHEVAEFGGLEDFAHRRHH